MTGEVAKAMKVVMGDIAGRDGRKGGDSGHENGCGWGGISRAIDDVWQPSQPVRAAYVARESATAPRHVRSLAKFKIGLAWEN